VQDIPPSSVHLGSALAGECQYTGFVTVVDAAFKCSVGHNEGQYMFDIQALPSGNDQLCVTIYDSIECNGTIKASTCDVVEYNPQQGMYHIIRTPVLEGGACVKVTCESISCRQATININYWQISPPIVVRMLPHQDHGGLNVHYMRPGGSLTPPSPFPC
jgi:hypothetical protein